MGGLHRELRGVLGLHRDLATAGDHGTAAGDGVLHLHRGGVGGDQAGGIQQQGLLHRGAGGLGIQPDAQRQVVDGRDDAFRPAQGDGCRGHGHVLHGQGPAAQGGFQHGPDGHAALGQGVGRDDDAGRLYVHQLEGPQTGAHVVRGQGDDGRALFDIGKIDGFRQAARRNGAQQDLRPAQAHLHLADKTVRHHQPGGDAVVFDAHFQLDFQTVAHADHIPHAHGHGKGHEQGKEMGGLAAVLREYH